MSEHKLKLTPDVVKFLAGAKVGRDNVKTVSLAELEQQVKDRERDTALKQAAKIYADFKWEAKKYERTPQELIDLINDFIIRIGLEIKHEAVRKEVVEHFEKAKAKLKE